MSELKAAVDAYRREWRRLAPPRPPACPRRRGGYRKAGEGAGYCDIYRRRDREGWVAAPRYGGRKHWAGAHATAEAAARAVDAKLVDLAGGDWRAVRDRLNFPGRYAGVSP